MRFSSDDVLVSAINLQDDIKTLEKIVERIDKYGHGDTYARDQLVILIRSIKGYLRRTDE